MIRRVQNHLRLERFWSVGRDAGSRDAILVSPTRKRGKPQSDWHACGFPARRANQNRIGRIGIVNQTESAMFTLSAFADEIDPEPQKQIEVLKSCGVRHIELRSILKTNVLALTDLQVNEFKSLLDRNGFKISAIGSPIG